MREAVATERGARLQRLATALARAGKHAEAVVVLERGAAAETERQFAGVERAALELCAEAPRVAGAAPGPRTFRDVADLWLSGELHRTYPDDVPAKSSDSVDQDRGTLARIHREVGSILVTSFTLADAERAKLAIPAGRRGGTRRRYALLIRRVLDLAVYPLKLIPTSPVPRKFVPSEGKARAFGFLYPDEDRQLLGCAVIPYDDRIFYGFVDRNGLRVSEAARLVWRDIDLVRGHLSLDKNKTSNPRSWSLAPDVVRALAAYRGSADADDLVFPTFIVRHAAERFRAHLAQAGVDRRELYATTKERRALRFHDLRATFATLALATGRTETWVMDRTGHTTSSQLNRYRRVARAIDLERLGWLCPLDEALGLVGLAQGVGQRVGQTAINADKKAVSPIPSWNGPGTPGTVQEPNLAAAALPTGPDTASGPAGFGGVGQTGLSETALADLLGLAAKAKRWDLTEALSAELRALAVTRTGAGVSSLDAARKRRDDREGK